MRITLAFLFILLLVGCGYKPSSKYARVIVGESVSTSITISAQDPENTVIIKDAVDLAVIEVFRTSLTDRAYSKTHLSLSISPPSYTPLQYDGDGFIIAYRATIVLGIVRETKDIKKHYSASGTYDFSIDRNAVITDAQRFDAIKFSATKAITSFIAQVSAEGSRVKNKE